MKHLFYVFLYLFLSQATAQNQPPAFVFSNCQIDLETFCKDVPADAEPKVRLKCLGQNHENVSQQCKQEIQRYFQASRGTAPPGGGPLGSIGGMMGLNNDLYSFSYEGRYQKNQNQNSLITGIPLYKNDRESIAAQVTLAHYHNDEIQILDTGINIAKDLYRTELGLSYSKKSENMRALGVKASVGYVGDKINSDTAVYNLNLNYFLPDADNSKNENKAFWVWFVMVSNNSPLGAYFPLPGFLYIYKTENFTGLFGIPILSLQWTFQKPWSLSFSVFGPNIKTEINYGLTDQMQIFVGSSWKQQRFILADHNNEKERLTSEEKNIEMGFRKPLFHIMLAEAQLGYTFDQSYYFGEKLYNRDGGYVSQSDALYLKASLKAVF